MVYSVLQLSSVPVCSGCFFAFSFVADLAVAEYPTSPPFRNHGLLLKYVSASLCTNWVDYLPLHFWIHPAASFISDINQCKGLWFHCQTYITCHNIHAYSHICCHALACEQIPSPCSSSSSWSYLYIEHCSRNCADFFFLFVFGFLFGKLHFNLFFMFRRLGLACLCLVYWRFLLMFDFNTDTIGLIIGFLFFFL